MIRFAALFLLAAAAVSGCGGSEPKGVLPVEPVGTVRDKIPMVLVAGGYFMRGRRSSRSDKKSSDKKNTGGENKKNDSAPSRRIYLDTFHIDKFEVTNAAYGRFVAATGHSPPGLKGSGHPWGGSWDRFAWSDRRPPPGAGDIPVTLITWFDAESYCIWAGKRLPSEAEWEKAARGAGSRVYPWGDAASPGAANFGGRNKGPLPGGSYPIDRSPYGVMDMAGNVAEWVNDYYHHAYFGRSPGRNPRGPERGSRRVVRGGYWSQAADKIRADRRWNGNPAESHGGVGFRCALPGEGVR